MKRKLTGVLPLCAGILSLLAIMSGCTTETKVSDAGAEKQLQPEKPVFVPAGKHVCEVSGPVKDAGALEIVVEQPCPVVKYAAKELQTCLKKATGQDIPVVKAPSGNKTALILGDCPIARAAGLDVTQIPDEGFRILRDGKHVFIAGHDSPKHDPAKLNGFQQFPRGTLTGVYDFLERFAGVRFFFPGRYGTVIPSANGLNLPEKINVLESPDMLVRTIYSGRPDQYFDSSLTPGQVYAMQWQRLRLSEHRIQFGHGLIFLNLIERFSKTHPEYFALRDDGKRYYESTMGQTGQLCFNSGVREVIYQDTKAYFTGQPSSSRGIKRWNGQPGGKFFCIMPQDGMYWCRCEKCRAVCDPKEAFTPKGRQAISNFMFRFTSEIAERLTKEGVDGVVTQMAYLPYDLVPDCKIPKNVLIQVAVNGSVDKNRSEDGEKLRAWRDKTGSRVSTWTYAMGKHMSKRIPALPQMMPREAATFIATYRDCLDGVFWEAETDVYLFNYLNYYIVSKLMWDASLDPDKLLDDHYQAMYGKGGPVVKQVFEALEDCWVKEVINRTVMDEMGPKVKLPGDLELWTKIYSPEKLARFEKLFDQAALAAEPDKEAVERVKFIRGQILEPLLKAQKKFQERQSSVGSWRVYCPDTVYLRPFIGEVNEVNTKVDVSREGDVLVFRFDCEEPRMKDLMAKHTLRDDPETWQDSAVEILINPSGDKVHYYHFIANANGALTDFRRELNKKPDISWDSSATARAEKFADRWKVEVKIPLKDLGPLVKDIPVNFARHRAVDGAPAVKEADYQWSPLPGVVRMGGFHAMERWGTLSLEKAPGSIIPQGNFTPEKGGTLETRLDGWGGVWMEGGKDGGQEWRLDDRIFISGGASLYMKNVDGKRMAATFRLPGLKPDTRYRLSYYIRTKDVKYKEKCGTGAYMYFNQSPGEAFPRVRLTGTNPWHRLSFDFTTPKDTGKNRTPVLGLWIWGAAGEVWFDKVELVELPGK